MNNAGISFFMLLLSCSVFYASGLAELEQLHEQLNILASNVEVPKSDDLLKELENLSKKFPEDQRRAFKDDTEGEKAKQTIRTALEKVAAHFGTCTTRWDFPKKCWSVPPKIWISFWVISDGVPVENFFTGERFPDASFERLHFKLKRVYATKPYNGAQMIAKEGILASDLEAFNQAVLQYKIHLMPFKNDIPRIIYMLMNKASIDSTFKNAIHSLKVLIENPNVSAEQSEDIVPTIVIYVANGKENAQLVLDEVYKLFQDIKGLGILPRFNEKVTSLIYFAQGDGNDKVSHRYLFEKGDDSGVGRVYYRPDLIGEMVDYHLKNPAKES